MPPCLLQSPWHEDHWGIRRQWRFPADCAAEWCQDVPQDWWGRCGSVAVVKRASACTRVQLSKPTLCSFTCRATKEWHRVPLDNPQATSAPQPLPAAGVAAQRPALASVGLETFLVLASAALAAWTLQRRRATERAAKHGKAGSADVELLCQRL